MSVSEQAAPETDADGDADADCVVGAALLSVGSGVGLAVAATGADEPPGEMSHHSSAEDYDHPEDHHDPAPPVDTGRFRSDRIQQRTHDSNGMQSLARAGDDRVG